MKSWMKVLIGSVLASGMALVSGSAHATVASGNVGVSMTVSNQCTISAATLAFGAYDGLGGGSLDNTAALTVGCTAGFTGWIGLGQGLNDTAGTPTAPQRQAASGANLLAYSLYQDSGHTAPWGNAVASGAPYSGTGSTGPVVIYGHVAAGQSVAGGTYTDTVIASITF